MREGCTSDVSAVDNIAESAARYFLRVTGYHADSSELETKEILTWAEFGNAGRELARQIADSGYQPEIVIAVARGGLLPAGHLAYALGVKLADAINVEFYTDVHETLPDPVLRRWYRTSRGAAPTTGSCSHGPRSRRSRRAERRPEACEPAHGAVARRSTR